MPAPYSPEPTREGRREPNAVRHALPLVSGGRRRRFDAAGDCASGCRPWAVGRGPWAVEKTSDAVLRHMPQPLGLHIAQ